MHVFISYSRADRRWVDRLLIHLRPFERDGYIDSWDDARLVSGSRWREEIRAAIARADAAILIVSGDFLASDFIATEELPPLLQAAERRGALIIPLIISGSVYDYIPQLRELQAHNAPSR